MYVVLCGENANAIMQGGNAATQNEACSSGPTSHRPKLEINKNKQTLSSDCASRRLKPENVCSPAPLL
jgi:hypothetical protein